MALARKHGPIVVLCAALATLGSAPAAGTGSVTDPRGDTTMMRGGPDIIKTTVAYTSKRIEVKVHYATDSDIDYARDQATITGAILKFKRGGTYTLQRKAADPGFQTPQADEVLVGQTSKRVKCRGVASTVSDAKRTVTVKAPLKCFTKDGPKVKAKGFSFTVNFDTDETSSTKWINRG
jgi:hypothetical protein